MGRIIFLSIFVFLMSGFFAVAHAQPAPPTIAISTVLSACGIGLEWTQGDPATYFRYDQSTSASFVPGTVVTFRHPPTGDVSPQTGTFTTIQDSLSADQPYYYRIRACDVSGCSASTNFNTGTHVRTDPLPSAPGAPTLLEAMGAEDVSVQVQNVALTWATTTEVSQYGGFSIFRSKNGDDYQFIDDAPYYWTAYNDPGLDLDGSYYEYNVYTFDSDAYCAVVPSGTDGPTAPPQPNNQAEFSGSSNTLLIPVRPTELAASDTGSDSIALSWTDNATNENFFELWKSTNEDFPLDARTATSSLSAGPSTGLMDSLDTNVESGPTYHYRIRACSAALSCSPFSNAPHATVGLTSPILGARLMHTSQASQEAEVLLTWDTKFGESYEVHRSTNRSFSFYDPFIPGTPGFWSDPNLPLGMIYYYRVRAEKAGIGSADSNIIRVNLDIKYVLKGVAWADVSDVSEERHGVGWIKLNSAAEGEQITGSGVPYSVQIDTDGLVTGMAWAQPGTTSGNYWWLSFNPVDLVGCPDAPLQTTPGSPCEARFDSGTRVFGGWARFLTPAWNPGGSNWDGWVHLSDTTQSFAFNPFRVPTAIFASVFEPFSLFTTLVNIPRALAQVTIEHGIAMEACDATKTCKLVGAAWGSDIVGWIGFGSSTSPFPTADACANANCTARAEMINEPPAVTDVTVTASLLTWCAQTPVYVVEWGYSDPDDDPMQSAEIKFIDPDGNIDLTTTSIPFDTSTYDLFFMTSVTNPLGFDDVAGTYTLTPHLDASTVYNVVVEVSDGFDVTSSTPATASSTLTTPTHYGPYIYDFPVDGYTAIVWDPDTPPEGLVLFDATSTAMFDDRSGQGIKEYAWTFEGASEISYDPTSSSTRVRIFSGTVTTTIGITDNLDDEFSFCAVEESYWFSDAGNIATKRRVFRER